MEIKIGDFEEKILRLLMLFILMISMFYVSREGALYINTISNQVEKEKVIVIDAGHGGFDPGKIGAQDQKEKVINLQIAEILKRFFELEGYRVVMTRTSDAGLYQESDSNKKVQDMKKRIQIIEENDPLLVLSVHQNSYTAENVRGAQVFYYNTSAQGKELAECIQQSLWELDPGHQRQAKGNTSYYLLKKTSKPIVIVECGFLSNREEGAKLSDSLYQEQLAFKIFLGTMQYINRLVKD